MASILAPGLLLSSPAFAESEAPAPRAVSLEVGQHQGRYRLAISFDRMPAFQFFTLENPDRLVVDFPALAWQADLEPLARLPLVTGLRQGLFRPGTHRVVMDLAGPISVDSAFLRQRLGSEELVFDLSRTSRAAFSAEAGWPEGARWEGAEVPPRRGEGLVVVIDPGHGGIDPGATKEGLIEKEIVLDFAERLAALLEAEPGMAAVMTRTDDVFLPLRARLKVGQDAGGHVFLSLHADAEAGGKADGVAIYTLSRQASDASAQAFAERENRSDVLAGADLAGQGDDVTRLLVDMARRQTQIESDRLGLALVESLEGRVDLLQQRPYRQAGFFVLRAPDMPSALIEIGYLSSE
ncbi:MAG: N-acetylmuramoyl-L-alanine amidase, partial [Pseudomonadota bacterium]